MKSENITLYFKQGNSDKVYIVSLEEVENSLFVVNFAYGRRGATLTTGTKTQKPVDYDSAKKNYDTLVKSKTSKGYKPGEEGPQYVHTDTDARETGIQCQLLNFIEESQVIQYINDDDWWAQEKYDGKRMLLHKTDTVTAVNRNGLSVGAPDKILKRAVSAERSFLVDGEAVGEKLFVFDMLEIDNKNIRSMSYEQRLSNLESLGLNRSIIVVKTAKTQKQKQNLYNRLHDSGAEGIVFKKYAAPYTEGRPSSSGTQVKFKFYNTASVVVTKINDRRSVGISMLANEKQVEVGNVTIPPNKDVPPLNSIIEVRYLYAYQGGSLYQPTYINVRDDIDAKDCVISQLKYKPS